MPRCQDAEAFMVANHRQARAPVAADVLIAPHQGANNASSACFIDAVDPEWVIFQAGHNHGHPRAAAERYLAEAVPLARILRTDRADDETGEPEEWKAGSVAGCSDGPGDDDIVIVLRGGGDVEVAYVDEATAC